ncbi:MAG TPA: TolC family protein [Gemmatimonadota bacterium]|nr:TolC family protein [Gemmatimonadota bacterium]
MRSRLPAAVLVASALFPFLAGPARGQEPGPADLAAVVAQVRAANPDIVAAERLAEAASDRAEAAGVLPDPRLGVGLTNALVGDPLSSDDFMTMRMVQLGAMLPWPGKLDRAAEAASWRAAAADADREAVERRVVAEAKRAWYELWFLDRALEVVRGNHALLADFVEVTEVRYGVGTGTQQDVLRARVEATRLGDEALDLERRRGATLATLNALLDRPAEAPIPAPEMPERVARLATLEPGTPVRFTAAALGDSREATGPIPALDGLQRAAETSDPRILARDARIAAAGAEARLADLAAFPDFDLTVGYGQRPGREDMVSVMVSAPLPLFKGKKQDALAEAAESEVAALAAERAATVNRIRADVTALRAGLVRTRERLGLLREGVIPQARASLESAVAGYPVATVDFLTLIDNQATLFRHELDERRLLADFGRDLAELERVIGREVIR